jgi:mannose-6-phosphate isomerase-like protein (cupin superfamily)
MAKNDWVSACPRVDKPWGYEDHFALAEGLYCGKILFVRAGHGLSLQLHEQKDETISVQRGHIVLEIGPDEDRLERFELLPRESARIKPTVIHRVTALADSYLLEASTTELTDVVRLADRYGRVAG